MNLVHCNANRGQKQHSEAMSGGPGIVKTHVNNIFGKLGFQDRVKA